MAARDLFVIRFDNRDVGLSTKTVGTTPIIMSLIAAIQSGQPLADVFYNLSDLADDAVAVLDEGRARSRITASYDRCFHPPGGAFQMAAIVTSGDRTPKLANVTTPTLVIHGGADPLVQPSGGEATANAIPGAHS